MKPSLSEIYVHPIKSTRGIEVSSAQVVESGLAFDRMMMLADPDGRFVTAREMPQLVLFQTALLPDGVVIHSPDGDSIAVFYRDFTQRAPSEVWGNHFASLVAPEPVNLWLSEKLGRALCLRWTGFHSERRVEGHAEQPLSYADGYPLLLISAASLDALQQRCSQPLTMRQFRPNLVVRDTEPFAEDSWKVIRIGEVIFDVVKPCGRCILTTVNPADGTLHNQREPLHTLTQFRRYGNDVDFGQNLIARNQGLVRLDMPVEVLETAEPRVYPDNAHPLPAHTHEERLEPLHSVLIETHGIASGDIAFTGNNHHTLLDQLEAHNVPIPSSCRAGLCGTCRVTLLSGEVTALTNSAVRGDKILACSCIPRTNLQLKLRRKVRE